MNKLILFFSLFLCVNVYSYENWIHRFHEQSGPAYEHKKNCSQMPYNEFEKTFSLELLEKQINQGVELDIFYREDIKDIVVFHKTKMAKNPDIHFQCFNGKFILMRDFLKLLSIKSPKTKVWLDLKNDKFQRLISAIDIIHSLPYKLDFITETSYFIPILYLKYKGLKSSLWVHRVKKKKSFFNDTENSFKIFMAKLIAPTRISQSCVEVLKLKKLFTTIDEIMCWKTSHLTKKMEDKLKTIKNLKVYLSPPLKK